jgi:hypothetical protein
MMKDLAAIALWLTAGLAPAWPGGKRLATALPEGGLCSAFASTFIRDSSALVPTR